MDDGIGLCAYVITRDHRLDLPGSPDLGPEIEPRLVAHRSLGLVVAEVPLTRFAEIDLDTTRDAAPGEDTALAALARQHDAVVRAVFRHEPVLPLRFGTVIRDEDAAVRLLDECHERARTWLDRVDGSREWGVRARLASTPEQQPRPARPAGVSGAEYLALRAKQLTTVEQARQRRSDAVRRLHDALVPQAFDSAFRGRAPGVLLDVAYLVPAGKESAFHATVEQFATEFGQDDMTVEITGPWPPYSFSRIEVTADA